MKPCACATRCHTSSTAAMRDGSSRSAGVEPPPTTSFVPKHGGRIATIVAPVAPTVSKRVVMSRVYPAVQPASPGLITASPGPATS